jgi:hypothetical protein
MEIQKYKARMRKGSKRARERKRETERLKRQIKN